MSIRSTHTTSRHSTRPPGRSGPRAPRRVPARAGGASVAQLVRAAGRGLRALRWAEAFLWSAAAVLLTGAAAVASSGVETDALVGSALRDLVLVAGALGAFTFAVVLRAGWPTDAGIVRDLDRRLQRRFALVAAFERERSGAPTEIDGLLSERARADLSTSDAFAGHANGAVPAVVAPLVAAALLGLALGPIDRPRTDVVDLTGKVAGDLGAAVARNADELTPAEQAALAGIVREIEQVSRRMDLESNAEAAANLERLRGELTARAAELDPSGELARQVEKALAALAAAERRVREAAGSESVGDGRAPDRDGAGGRAPQGADAGAATGGDGAGVGDGGPAEPGASDTGATDTGAADAVADPSGADPSGAEAAGVRRAWLEPRERALVEAWVERRRRDALGDD